MDEASLQAEAARRSISRPLHNRVGLTWADILRQTHRSLGRTLMRKHPAQHPEDVTVMLYAWLFEDGFDFPYVTSDSRAALVRETGLDGKQLGYWLTNARKRVWAPIRKRLGLPLVTAADRIRVQARDRARAAAMTWLPPAGATATPAHSAALPASTAQRYQLTEYNAVDSSTGMHSVPGHLRDGRQQHQIETPTSGWIPRHDPHPRHQRPSTMAAHGVRLSPPLHTAMPGDPRASAGADSFLGGFSATSGSLPVHHDAYVPTPGVFENRAAISEPQLQPSGLAYSGRTQHAPHSGVSQLAYGWGLSTQGRGATLTHASAMFPHPYHCGSLRGYSPLHALHMMEQHRAHQQYTAAAAAAASAAAAEQDTSGLLCPSSLLPRPTALSSGLPVTARDRLSQAPNPFEHQVLAQRAVESVHDYAARLHPCRTAQSGRGHTPAPSAPTGLGSVGTTLASFASVLASLRTATTDWAINSGKSSSRMEDTRAQSTPPVTRASANSTSEAALAWPGYAEQYPSSNAPTPRSGVQQAGTVATEMRAPPCPAAASEPRNSNAEHTSVVGPWDNATGGVFTGTPTSRARSPVCSSVQDRKTGHSRASQSPILRPIAAEVGLPKSECRVDTAATSSIGFHPNISAMPAKPVDDTGRAVSRTLEPALAGTSASDGTVSTAQRTISREVEVLAAPGLT